MPVHLFESSELEAAGPGRWRVPPVSPDLPARSVVVSWNLARQPDQDVEARVRVRREGAWSPWIPMARRGPGAGEAPPPPGEGLRRAGDELVSEGACLEQAELELRTPGPAPRRVGVAFWPVFAPFELPHDPCSPALESGRVRQYQLGEEGGRLCGPSSLAMALRALGEPAEPLEVAAAARCPWDGIYGNWTQLAAAAGERGRGAWVERGGGPARLGHHLGLGRLVILSLQWEEHELPGAAVPRSDGHLVLAVGCDARGVQVMDPAFRDPEVQLVTYDWQGLLRAWKSGASIVLTRGP